MEPREFQERLVKLGRDFEKLVFTQDVPRGTWADFVIRYKGSEVFQGVLAENIDIVVKDVGKVGDATEILVSVKSNSVSKQSKNLTVYFDPPAPFYRKVNGSIVEPNTQKLKQQIQFIINGTSLFETEELNIGGVDKDTIVQFEFVYRGTEPISGVKGTCGCTNVSLVGNKIIGQVDTNGFKGEWSKHVNVYLGDHENYYYSKDGVLKQNPSCSVIPLFIKGHIKS